MRTSFKMLLAGACLLAATASASAHGKVRAYVEMRPYHPPLHAQRYYAPPGYYRDPTMVVAPQWQHRRDWRREQWRRDHWRQDYWQHNHRHCRHHHR